MAGSLTVNSLSLSFLMEESGPHFTKEGSKVPVWVSGILRD